MDQGKGRESVRKKGGEPEMPVVMRKGKHRHPTLRTHYGEVGM